MARQAHRLERDFVRSAEQFLLRHPWRDCPEDALFLLRIPTEKAPVIATIMGFAGDEHGLTLIRGVDALPEALDFFRGQPDNGGFIRKNDVCSFIFESWGKVSDPFRRIAERAGHQPRREKLIPIAYSSPTSEAPRPASRADLRSLLWAIRGIMAALDQGVFKPLALEGNASKIFELVVTGKPNDPTVTGCAVDWPATGRAPQTPAALPEDLAELPRLDESWCMGCIDVPFLAKEVGLPIEALVIGATDGSEFGTGAARPPDFTPALKLCFEAFRGECSHSENRGLPREIICSDRRLIDSLGSVLSTLGVGVVLDPEHLAFINLLDDIEDRIRQIADEAANDPRSLAYWQERSPGVSERLRDELHFLGVDSHRAHMRYFGDEPLGFAVFRTLPHLSPRVSYEEWLATDYRPTKRSKTLVEKLLQKKKLAPEVRALYEARRDAKVSIFRIIASDPGIALDIEDVFTGERHTVYDTQLSTCELENMYIPLRLLRAGDFLIPLLFGPPIPTLRIDEALSILEQEGAELTPEGLRRDAHLIGRLWSMLLGPGGSVQTARRPTLTNTDGDLLEPQSATFHVADQTALLREFERRDELDFDPHDGIWVWGRPTESDNPDEYTLLGRISLFDDRLLLEVNSVRRLETARVWLEQVAGVRFESCTAQPLERPDRPLDDRLPSPPPEPLDPEISKHIEQMIHRQCMAWADESIPMLGGKTPREACKSAKGRKQVARMIRTMPPILGNSGKTEPPREELLRDLGLLD